MSYRRAKKLYEAQKLLTAMEENRKRLLELDAMRTGGCPACRRRGWIK